MASNNRSTKINKVLKVVKKHFKPSVVPHERTILEHLVFACCVENSLSDDAEKVFSALSNDYFDWNEVRVSTVRELSDLMKPLNDAEEAATRVKRVLQSVFETLYSFDLESMKKQNIGQSIKQLERFHGTTPFTVAYVNQHGLGGHSIPISQGLLQSMWVVGVISEAEAKKGTVPGLERAVPKTKGTEVASLLHQLGVEMYRSPFGPTIRKLLLDIEPTCKERLPKRQSKKSKVDAETGEMAHPVAGQAAADGGAKKKAAGQTSGATKPKKKTAARAPGKKKVTTPKKKVVRKQVKSASAKSKPTTNKKLKKKKPR